MVLFVMPLCGGFVLVFIALTLCGVPFCGGFNWLSVCGDLFFGGFTILIWGWYSNTTCGRSWFISSLIFRLVCWTLCGGLLCGKFVVTVVWTFCGVPLCGGFVGWPIWGGLFCGGFAIIVWGGCSFAIWGEPWYIISWMFRFVCERPLHGGPLCGGFGSCFVYWALCGGFSFKLVRWPLCGGLLCGRFAAVFFYCSFIFYLLI